MSKMVRFIENDEVKEIIIGLFEIFSELDSRTSLAFCGIIPTFGRTEAR